MDKSEAGQTPKTFEVVYLSPTDLKPYFRNNKAHTHQQIRGLSRILRQHGFDQPIVVDANKVIIKGHGRYLASLEARFDIVPVVIRTDLTPEQVMASRIADNKAFMLSAIDEDASRAEITDFVQQGGVGAEFFFDFLRPAKTPGSSGSPAAAPAAVAPAVGGKLLSCPKCTHTYMEEGE